MPKSRSRSRSRSPKKSRSRSRSPAGSPSVGYCVKCRAKRTMQNPKKMRARNGRNMMCGKCPKCATKMCRFVKG